MGETDGDPQPSGEPQPSPGPEERPSPGPGQDTLQVPTGKRRRIKSPTPGSIRGRSMTPVRGRSRTPFTLYMERRSATPSTWRSITPFLKRESREKTPFELGTSIKVQLDCNKAVFDKALIMDITEPEVAPVRYITTDLSVIDRAAVMDVSNVEVIYVVEEYDESEDYTEEEDKEEDVEKKKKKPKKKDKEAKPKKKTAAEKAADKREKREKSPSPKLSLKLEIGGGPKINKKLFDKPAEQPAPKEKPPPKKAKSKLVLQMEEQAKAAKAASDEAAKKDSEKPKRETFEERQKRLKAEKEAEDKARAEMEELQRAIDEERRREEAEQDGEEENEGDESEFGEGGSDEEGDDGSGEGESEDDGAVTEGTAQEELERDESVVDSLSRPESRLKAEDSRRGSSSSRDSFVRVDPEEEARWQKIAEEEGEEFMLKMRKASQIKAKSEKERHADWQKHREAVRPPSFINFLTDRTTEVGTSVRLACAVDGPDLSVKWFKDGRQIERDAQHRIANNNNILSLEIVNGTAADSGEYSCIISNPNDEVTSSCIVTIYEVYKDEPRPPTFTLIRDFYHLHDDELTIECHISGIPRPKITWLKDNFELQPNYKYTMLEEAHGVCKLMIYRPSGKDSGKYVCRAVNASGELDVMHKVEFVKAKKVHAHGVFRAHGEIQKEKEETARRAMEEAMKSKQEYDKKRGEDEGVRRARSSVEPVVTKNKLKYASQLRDRIALEGAKVKLVCSIIGPNPSVKWLKDDNPLVYGPKVRNLSSENVASLEFSQVTSENSGVYKCIAKNDWSEIDTSCYLKVYSAQSEGDEQEPMFVLPMRDVYHSSENDLVIDTKVRGNPRPKISWLKDEMPIENDGRIQQIEHLDGVCELVINKPTPKDNGKYTCAAENNLGSQKTTHSVLLEVLPPSRRSSGSMGVIEEKEAKKRTAGGGPDQEGKPPVKGQKKKAEDEAEAGGRRRHESPEVSPKNKLYFAAMMSNRYLAEGSKVKMSAVLVGPDPQIRWLKDGNNVAYGPRIKNMSREGLAVLEITNAQKDDSGIYTLIAKNPASEITSEALLHIYQAKVSADLEPMFTRALKDTYHLNTNELILESHVRGEPAPTVAWVKDGIELQNSEKYQILHLPDGTCQLVIDKPTSKDSGKYVCQAESPAGKAEISHFVLFEGKESHIAENIHGVFHADMLLLKKGKEAGEKLIAGEAASAENAEEEDAGKGKGKAKSKGAKKEAEAPEVPDTDSKPAKEEKREKKVGIHFAAKLSDRVVAEGSKVKLTCYVEGPDPQVRWLKDEQTVVYGPKVRQNYREGLCTLELLSASETDSGSYQCYARNPNGECSTVCNVTVYKNPGSADVPPTFTRAIKDTYHGKVNELVLDCHVRGLPTPTISWVKDGVRLEPSDKYQQIDHADGTCELFINDPIPYDSGKYVCQADNRVDKSEISHIVHLEAKNLRATSPGRETVRKDEAPDAKEKPAVDGKAEEAKDDAKADEKKSDKKEAKAKSGKKGETEEISVGRRNAAPLPDPKKCLYFGNYLSNRTIAEGSSLRMSVFIGGPDPQVRWMKDEQVVVYGPRTKSACQDGLATLVLSNLTPDDSGEYKLIARNSENEITSSCRVTVYPVSKNDNVAPVFTVGIKDTYYLNEDELVLDCRIRGNPRPEISWMKDTDMISNDKKYQQFDQGDGYCKLIVREPTEKDSGTYYCRADNGVGAEKMAHVVEFKGRERFILEKAHGFFHRDPNKPHLTNILGDHMVTAGGTVAIQAEFGKTSTPIEVQWLKDKSVIATSPNIRTFVDHGVYTLAIEKATQEIGGTYTCRASNAFGRLESNANVHIVAPVIKGGKAALFLSRPETEMKIAVNDPFSISFRVQGEPKPKLILMKGTKDITKSDRVSKEAQEDYIRFTVHNSTISDSGTYFVVARNEHGTDRLFVTVTVMPRARSETPTFPPLYQPSENYRYFKNPPGCIPSEPIAVDVGKNHVSLSWAKPESHDSAPVLAYRIEAWLVGKDGGAIWKELGITPITMYDAFNLKSGCEYHFRVTPRNRYGWGGSSQTSKPVMVGGCLLLPEFTKLLSGQRKALINRECVLECVVRGTPKPTVEWFKDGFPMESTDRLSISCLGSTCKLKISQVFEMDSGRYTCEATNSQGKASTFARVQVVTDPLIYETDMNLKKFINGELSPRDGMLPHFTMRLRDRRVQVTYAVRLTCQVIGQPEPDISWYKDGDLIENNERHLIWNEGQFSTVEIASTCLNDSGIYTATAKNELGSVSCHCRLTVDKGIRAYIVPEFTSLLDPVYVFDQGEEIRLSAQVEAYPMVGISWLRNGIRIRPSRRILANLDRDGFVELIIANANQRDAGIYSCIASNTVGNAESSCRVAMNTESTKNDEASIPTVRGADIPYSKEPMFVTKPRSSEAFEGDTVIIQCEVIGDPKPEVIWLRDFLNPDYYKDAPHFKRVGDGPEYRLIIPRAKLDFTGTYSIIAKNCNGDVKAIISLQIYAKDIAKAAIMEKGAIIHGNVETLPSISRHLSDIRCCDGDSVTLECHVVGVPEPIIIWEKDGRKLVAQRDIVTSYDGSRATLSIDRVYPEDEGEYTCMASNNIGRAYSTACIIVDVPEEKENLLTVQLSRPPGLLSTQSTPRSTPRTTPSRSISPFTLSFKSTSIDLTPRRRNFAAPKFLAVPHNKIVEEGETVVLQCAISGHPMPWFTWDKNGIIVTPTKRISIKERDDLRILQIEEVIYDDAGLYRITLENDYGRIEATARLDVIRGKNSTTRPVRTYSASPRRHIYLSRRLMGNSTAIGGRLALSCVLRGSSAPSRKFYHNGLEICEDSRVSIILTETESTLVINEVEECDEGDYTLLAKNDFGTVSSSVAVNLYPSVHAIMLKPPKILKPLDHSINIYEGITTDLVFVIESSEPYTYNWYKDGIDLIDSDEFSYIDHGNGHLALRISDPMDIDSGFYSCTVKTNTGNCKTSTSVYIEENMSGYNVNQLNILKDLIAKVSFVGEVVRFSAKVFPENAPTFWTVCGSSVEHDSREFSLESQNDGVRILNILGADFKHSGEITLTVQHPKNKDIVIRSHTQLVVLPPSIFNFEDQTAPDVANIPAHIVQPPNDCTGFIGGTLVLEATFDGSPPPAVRWMKAGRPIKENTNVKIHTVSKRSTLILSSITGDDSGKYTVEIMNDYGKDSVAASVAVEGPPEPPSGKPSISQGPDRVAVAWCGPPYDGGCALTGFILELKQENADWIEIATVVDSLAYTVKNLTPGRTYQFRVRAENIHGRSEPSFPSNEVTVLATQSINEVQESAPVDIESSLKLAPGGTFKSRFTIIEELGRGRFGTVYKVTEKDTGQVLAAKLIKCIKSRDKEKVQEEISIMKSLDHPKLLQLATVFDGPREVVMVMEYITGGELFERVVADDFTLTEHDCILFLRQICEGVNYMHSKSIVHLDLKPENIMCRTRSSHQIKIIDFGLAQRLNDNKSVRVLFGTPEFIAPEIINYEPIGLQTDMWSVGVICYVLLSGLSPFMGDSDVETFANIIRADYDFDVDAFDAVSQDAKDFISSLLIYRKEDRPTASVCLESNWLAQHSEPNLSTVKICTDKLKKFIIRRKWQKTGNAIRALGRMATLSASRRNSATCGSLPNSPRPSISTDSGYSTCPISVPMSSLNEESYDTDEILPASNEMMVFKRSSNGRVRDKAQFSERSDSGFSECSSCNTQTQIIGKVPIIKEELLENNSMSLPNAIEHDVLRSKLEAIAKHVEGESNVSQDNSEFSTIPQISKVTEKASLLEGVTIEVPSDYMRHDSTSSPDLKMKDSFLKSDFTNTVGMRKKSLESSYLKEKVIPKKSIFETSGKVSKLRSKFTKENESDQSKPAIVSKSDSKHSTSSQRMDLTKNVFDRLTSSDKSKVVKRSVQTVAPATSPSSSTSSRATMRLTSTNPSGRASRDGKQNIPEDIKRKVITDKMQKCIAKE